MIAPLVTWGLPGSKSLTDGARMILTPHRRAWIVTVDGEHMGSVKRLKSGWVKDPMFSGGRWAEAMDRAIEALDKYLGPS